LQISNLLKFTEILAPNFGKHTSVVVLHSLPKFGAKISVISYKFQKIQDLQKEIIGKNCYLHSLCNLFSARNVNYQNQTLEKKRIIFL
jgi:hypothetical protein